MLVYGTDGINTILGFQEKLDKYLLKCILLFNYKSLGVRVSKI